MLRCNSKMWKIIVKNQFPELPFCGPYSKPHGARGLSKHYHLLFYPKIGMGVCAILRIPCVCVACTSILYKPCISGISSDKQERYKPVTKCTYWPLLGAFDHWSIILLSSKSTSYDTFDEIHQVVVDVSVVFMAPYVPDSTNDTILSLITSTTTWCISSNVSYEVDFHDNLIMFQLLKAPNNGQ